MVVQPPPPPLVPCPLSAGWDKVAEVRLPRLDGAGQPSGGFSAASYRADRDELWLLSDAPVGQLVGWSGLGKLGKTPLRPLGVVPLRSGTGANLPESMDGEGLVLQGERAWVVSEGRRTPERPPQLLRFNRRSGELELAMPMPAAWQPAPGQGLASNGGPESLTLLRRRDKPAVLLIAAESALLQDPPGQVRVLGWPLDTSMESLAGDPEPRQPLRLPQGDGWGLTDLLALPETSNEALCCVCSPPASRSLHRGMPTTCSCARQASAPCCGSRFCSSVPPRSLRQAHQDHCRQDDRRAGPLQGMQALIQHHIAEQRGDRRVHVTVGADHRG